MTIEWGGLGLESTTTSQVLDPAGQLPSQVIDEDDAFQVSVKWTVPAALAPYLGGEFRLRCFAESVGPGPERQIGATVMVPVVPGLASYSNLMALPPGTLPGEGASDGAGGFISGMYQIATVVQHMNGGATPGCGYSEQKLIQIRRP